MAKTKTTSNPKSADTPERIRFIAYYAKLVEEPSEENWHFDPEMQSRQHGCWLRFFCVTSIDEIVPATARAKRSYIVMRSGRTYAICESVEQIRASIISPNTNREVTWKTCRDPRSIPR